MARYRLLLFDAASADPRRVAEAVASLPAVDRRALLEAVGKKLEGTVVVAESPDEAAIERCQRALEAVGCASYVYEEAGAFAALLEGLRARVQAVLSPKPVKPPPAAAPRDALAAAAPVPPARPDAPRPSSSADPIFSREQWRLIGATGAILVLGAAGLGAFSLISGKAESPHATSSSASSSSSSSSGGPSPEATEDAGGEAADDGGTEARSRDAGSPARRAAGPEGAPDGGTAALPSAPLPPDAGTDELAEQIAAMLDDADEDAKAPAREKHAAAPGPKRLVAGFLLGLATAGGVGLGMRRLSRGGRREGLWKRVVAIVAALSLASALLFLAARPPPEGDAPPKAARTIHLPASKGMPAKSKAKKPARAGQAAGAEPSPFKDFVASLREEGAASKPDSKPASKPFATMLEELRARHVQKQRRAGKARAAADGGGPADAAAQGPEATARVAASDGKGSPRPAPTPGQTGAAAGAGSPREDAGEPAAGARSAAASAADLDGGATRQARDVATASPRTGPATPDAAAPLAASDAAAAKADAAAAETGGATPAATAQGSGGEAARDAGPAAAQAPAEGEVDGGPAGPAPRGARDRHASSTPDAGGGATPAASPAGSAPRGPRPPGGQASAGAGGESGAGLERPEEPARKEGTTLRAWRRAAVAYALGLGLGLVVLFGLRRRGRTA